ncbi:hypothetical protein BH23VER1_BH23VER1_05280 [soil metagenome]
MTSLRTVLLAAALLGLPAPRPATAANLGFSEQIAVETFASMREVERFQLKVAEKFYLQDEFAIAADEYEKFLTLYESSPGAPYAQLMWSHCQRQLRHVNTAIRDGFRSVIDYWPDSPEAIVATYLIADSYRSIGEVEKAESGYLETISDFPRHHVALRSKLALLDLAKAANDPDKILATLVELTFETERTDESREHCTNASLELAKRYLYAPDLARADEALATSIPDEDPRLLQLQALATDPIRHLRENERPKESDRLATYFIAALDQRIPADLSADEARAAARDLLFRIASLQSAAGRADDVLATYLRATKLLGEDDDILARMAEWHKALGRRDEARRIYLRFDDQVAGRRNIAGMFREESRWDDAIATYQDLIALDSARTSEYHWAIAECHEASERFRDAITSYRLTDSLPASYFRMASCHRRLSEFTEALSLYNQIKSAGDSIPEANLQIAFTWEEAAHRENAIKAFQLTCKSHPKSPQASQAHAHLQDAYKITITLGGATDD